MQIIPIDDGDESVYAHLMYIHSVSADGDYYAKIYMMGSVLTLLRAYLACISLFAQLTAQLCMFGCDKHILGGFS